MNKILVIVMTVLSISNMTMAKTKVCALKDNKALEIEIISHNIANVETTRTPEGGPYKRKQLVCKTEFSCQVEEDKKEFTLIYLPRHYDAQETGYVQFPAIDLKEEIKNLISAQAAYERLKKTCSNQAENLNN